jgi:hypothetical protein
MKTEKFGQPDVQAFVKAADAATMAIPPLWPLASSVAVNPFLGQTGESLAQAGSRLARVAGVSVTMPRCWYLDRIGSGAISDEDLLEAMSGAPANLRPIDLAALKTAARAPASKVVALPTITDLAAEASGIDWPSLMSPTRQKALKTR